MITAKQLRRGTLPLVFGIAALHGAAAPALAQAPASPPGPTPTAASQELAAMASHYRSQPGMPQITVIDPDDLSTTSGFLSSQRRVATVLERQGIDVHRPRNADTLEWFETSNGTYSPNEQMQLGRSVFHARVAFFGQGGSYTCAVMPADTDFTFRIDGLTAEQNRIFINRHEFHHCADRGLAGRMMATSNAHDHAPQELNRRTIQELAQSIRSETLADLNALSDMVVLDGMDLDIFTALDAFRERELAHGHDLAHFSSIAVIALRDNIEDLGGAQAYRDLSPRARARMIDDACNQGCVTTGAVAHYISAAQNGIYGIRVSARDRHLGELIKLSHISGARRNAGTVSSIAFTEAETRELQSWNADEALVAQAQQDYGDASQFSLISARNSMIDALRDEIRKEPANAVHGARIILLEGALQRQLGGAQAETAATPGINPHSAVSATFSVPGS